MKGILSKTENGWVVRYDRRTLQDPSAEDGELPLLPDDLWVIDHTGYALGVKQEIEFEEITEDIVNPINKHLIKFTYAKLIHHSVDTTKMINHIGEANEMVCMFEPRTDTSSATVCKHCGQEKFLHNQVPDVRKMVSNVEKLAEQEYREFPHSPKDRTDYHYNRDIHCFKKRKAFIKGYNKAKETLYTKEQVQKMIDDALTNYEIGWADRKKQFTLYEHKETITSCDTPVSKTFLESASKQETLFTIEDMLQCWNTAYVDAMSIDEYDYKPTFFEDFIQSLKQPKP